MLVGRELLKACHGDLLTASWEREAYVRVKSMATCSSGEGEMSPAMHVGIDRESCR